VSNEPFAYGPRLVGKDVRPVKENMDFVLGDIGRQEEDAGCQTV
jgi:hypothetical protein